VGGRRRRSRKKVSKALMKSFKQLHNQNMSLKGRHFLDQIFYGTVYE